MNEKHEKTIVDKQSKWNMKEESIKKREREYARETDEKAEYEREKQQGSRNRG